MHVCRAVARGRTGCGAVSVPPRRPGNGSILPAVWPNSGRVGSLPESGTGRPLSPQRRRCDPARRPSVGCWRESLTGSWIGGGEQWERLRRPAEELLSVLRSRLPIIQMTLSKSRRQAADRAKTHPVGWFRSPYHKTSDLAARRVELQGGAAVTAAWKGAAGPPGRCRRRPDGGRFWETRHLWRSCWRGGLFCV